MCGVFVCMCGCGCVCARALTSSHVREGEYVFLVCIYARMCMCDVFVCMCGCGCMGTYAS